jgi:restriction system protein
MAIPDYESLMLPLLKLAAAAEPDALATPSAVRTLAEELGLTPEDRSALLPSGGHASWRDGAVGEAKGVEHEVP